MIKFAAISMIALGVIHMFVLGSDVPAELPRWLNLNLWTFDHWQAVRTQEPDLALSNGVFWSTLGSFAIPGIMFGALLLVAVREGWRVPVAFGWVWLAWALLATLLMPPSGFPIMLIVTVILTIGLYRQGERA